MDYTSADQPAHDHRRKALSTLSQEDSAIDSAHASTANQQIPSVEHFDLQTAIETLPDKYRIPILLKYFSGMTVDEIAGHSVFHLVLSKHT